MADITLPPMPRSASYRMRAVYAASDPARPAAGGAPRPMDRPGDYWAMEIDTGALGGAHGLEFMANLVRGRGRIVALRLPTFGVDTGAVGLPVVDGEDVAGEMLPVRGLTANYPVRPGFLSILRAAGGRSTHLTSGEVIANADGEATLTLWPMLWKPVEDGDVVEIAEPWIEGRLVEGGDLETGLLPTLTPGAWTIEEAD